MELPIDQEDFDNEIFETFTSPKSQDEKRYCPQCNNIVVGRANKKFDPSGSTIKGAVSLMVFTENQSLITVSSISSDDSSSPQVTFQYSSAE